MEIKKKERSSLYNYLKKSLKIIYRIIFNKKTKILLLIVIMISLFLIGSLFGLVVSGFFGTFDEPSQNAIDLIHSFGILGLRSFKEKIEGILDENIKIPLNYIKGQFSNPERVYIDISFQDYKKLEYNRQQALEKGVILSQEMDYVPAKIRYEDKEISTDIRLKGDWIDHLEGEKWSFRIKVKGDETLFGMKTFSIQRVESKSYISPLIYYYIIQNSDILAPRTKFVEFFINGEKKGIYNLQEHFDKELIENNNQRQGVIIKFNDDLRWSETARVNNIFPNRRDLFDYHETRVLDWFYSDTIEPLNPEILDDPILSIEFEKAKNLLESFREGSLKTSQVFDTDKLARYLAINVIIGNGHPSDTENIRFYYNPLTSLLEPIAYDGAIGSEVFAAMNIYLPNCLITNENDCSEKQANWYDLIFRDKSFFEKYIKELENISKESYLDEIFLGLDESIEKNINIIHKDYPTYHFSKEILYENLDKIKYRLNPVKSLNVYLQESLPSENKIILSVGNIDYFPLEIVNLVYNDSIIFELSQGEKFIQPKDPFGDIEHQNYGFEVPINYLQKQDFISNLKVNYKIIGTENILSQEIIPWTRVGETFLEEDFIRNESNLTNFNFLKINEETKSIVIQKGKWILDRNLIIPPGFSVFSEGGTIINLINGATILSYSNLQFSGTEENPIEIVSLDGTGQGLAVLNTNKVSNLNHVVFDNLSNPSKQGWTLTGAVTFYNSQVIMNNILFKEINAEDSLNVVNTKFEIKNSTFKNCFSDCFDGDFVNGSIETSLFDGANDDGIDFSGSSVDIKNVQILNIGDKGISIGEKSKVRIENAQINNNGLNKTYICIASKDKSEVFIENIQLSDCEYGFAVYQKKSEFGPASINGKNIDISNINNDYIIDSGSSLSLENKIILGSEKKVYEKLYGVK